MVVADQANWQADVVFVIEGTANISPYVESLKSHYIIPTLEYFNGAPADDKDVGNDANCTMYALVVFTAADCALETAATCFAPTGSTHKFLQWLDKVKFVGGAGESHSHIAEGLSTALQVFDDFQTYRENHVAAQKHCILISNSPPYPQPALESSAYSGLMTEQLASLMADRQINLSILSPRKIPALFNIYEEAGGDLQHALTKNYAKDRRHLVLLKGYQLLERPMTPPTLDSKAIPMNASACSPSANTGQKRPATNSPPNPREATGFKQPATQANYTGLDWNTTEIQSGPIQNLNPVQSGSQAPNPRQMPTGYGQNPMPGQLNICNAGPGFSNPTSNLKSMNQPNPPNVTILNKGPSPHADGIRPQRGLSPVPTGGPRMPWTQTSNPSSPVSAPQTTSVLAAQLSMGPSNMPMRHLNPQMHGINNVPMAQAQSAMNNRQNPISQTFPRVGSPLMNAPSSPTPILGPPIQKGAQGLTDGAAIARDRRTVWQGVLDFQEKSNIPQGQRVVHSLACTFSSMVTPTGDVDVIADKWPNRLVLQLIPRQIIAMSNLFTTLKTAARHVIIHFNQQSESLNKLCKTMSSGLVGCIQFPQPCDIKIMVVLFMPDKQIYMGFIVHDQEGFLSNIKQRYEAHRKQQQLKMMGNIPPTDGPMGIQPQNPPNPNMMMQSQPPVNPNLNPNSNQMNAYMPVNPQHGPQQVNLPPQQTCNQQPPNANNPANAARLNQIEAARQQNLMTIQQLQQTLEAAQQKELQFKAAQEQQKQQQVVQQQQTMLERQTAIQQLEQQLQHQQQQLAQQQQQSIQMQQIGQQQGHNPQLRNLLQQQQVQQQMRRQQQQQMLMQQHPQGMQRPQMPGNMIQGGVAEQQQQNPQQQWAE